MQNGKNTVFFVSGSRLAYIGCFSNPEFQEIHSFFHCGSDFYRPGDNENFCLFQGKQAEKPEAAAANASCPYAFSLPAAIQVLRKMRKYFEI